MVVGLVIILVSWGYLKPFFSLTKHCIMQINATQMVSAVNFKFLTEFFKY